MKKLIILLLLSLSTPVVFGQGIRFVSSYEEALKQAAEKNLRIFIDVYTQWCGPCKMMAAETFPLKEVGSYFNKNFVSLQLDAETPEGRVLAKKFGVNAYPTLVFLDPEGNILGKEAGARDAKGLLELAKNCENPQMVRVNALAKKFESGQMEREELETYIQLLRETKLPVVKPLETWMKMLPDEELISVNTYNEIRKQRLKPGDYPFDFLLTHYDAFARLVDKASFDSYLYVVCMFESYENNRAKVNNEAYWQKLSQTGLYFVPALRECFYLITNLLKDTAKYDEFIVRTRHIVAAYPVCASEIGSEMIKRAYGKNVKLMEFAHELLGKAAEFDPKRAASVASSYVSVLLINAHDFETANFWVDKYTEWRGDPEYEKDKALYVKRSLGLANCENYGTKMYDFKLSDINGKKVSLTDFRGKYVLLDFWASWCEPCKGEIPYLKTASEKYGKKGLVVISITCDEKEDAWKKAVEREKMDWIQLTARRSDVYKRYKINGIPRIMLLDKEGRLIGDEMRGTSIEAVLKKNIQ